MTGIALVPTSTKNENNTWAYIYLDRFSGQTRFVQRSTGNRSSGLSYTFVLFSAKLLRKRRVEAMVSK